MTTTLDQARVAYLTAAGLGDGGYDDTWIKFKLGPVPFWLYNFEGRKRVVKIHDFHHALTGYIPDWRGEFAISGWELGGGCGRYWAAWFINLQGFLAGLLVAPRRVARAFYRGKRSRNLYRTDVGPLVGRDVEDVRRELHIPPMDDDTPPTGAERWALLRMTGLAAATILGPVALGLGLVLAWVFAA